METSLGVLVGREWPGLTLMHLVPKRWLVISSRGLGVQPSRLWLGMGGVLLDQAYS